MGTLLSILAILFLALFIVIPLVERFGKRYSNEDMQKLRRWFFPLLLLLLIVQSLRYFF